MKICTAVLLFFAVVAMLTLSACYGEKHPLLVCFGDSLTAGYKVDAADAYPAQLAKMISLPVRNEGSIGETTLAATRRIDNILELCPSHVIVEFGANDFLLGTPAVDFEKGITTIIKSFKEHWIKVAVIQFFDDTMVSLTHEADQKRLNEYQEVYRKLTTMPDLIVIKNVWGSRFNDASLKVDAFHPNAKGYKDFSKEVYKQLNAVEFFIQ